MSEGRPTVAIVLCTWQGERHLGEQLDSLAAQSWPIALTVHDDASRDASAELARRHSGVERVVAHADNVGYVGNFERGIARALADGHDYIALADQDDVWDPCRVERGMRLMLETEAHEGRGRPVLVHSDLTLVDELGQPLAPSFLSCRGYAIGDAPNLALVLGQNGVMGNTVLVNRALATLALPFPSGLHVHDWWLAVIAELHGRRRLVERPTVAYRLHAGNASNPAGSVAPGALAVARRMTWKRLRARDFRLPFKEDSRDEVLAGLLAESGRRAVVDPVSRRLMTRFLAYLRLERPAPVLFASLLRHGFLRHGIAHRARVALALAFSARYDGARPRR